jgi:tetratricopeptide (TPR) repeat protein
MIQEAECSLQDERFTSLLAAWDEMLAAGLSPLALEGLTPASGLGSRLLKGAACLHRLATLWPTSPDMATAPPQAPPFTHLGRFQVEQEIGRGGFGVVYRAHDPELGRDVALKIPHANVLFRPDLQRRFQYEAQTAARLDHLNIVPVHEAGSVGHVFYIASAYCPGPTLATWLKEHPQNYSPAQAADLMATLADAVQHAHCRGVLHRDLKPANILLQMPNDEGRMPKEQPATPAFSIRPSSFGIPRITDFGLAKQLDLPESWTAHDAMLGTPHYMAPEQASGKSKEVGVAADVYALGAIFYELLTGRPPFLGEGALHVLDQVRTAEPVPPRKLRTEVPADLETICLKCLAKEPQRRYGSAGELADDLRRHLRGEPIRARSASVGERIWKWAKRRPSAAALLAVIILAILGLCGGTAWHLSEVEGALTLAENRRVDAEREQSIARKHAQDADKERNKADMAFRQAELHLSQTLRVTDLLLVALQDPDQPERVLQSPERAKALSQAAVQLHGLLAQAKAQRYKAEIVHQLHERLAVTYHLQGYHAQAEKEMAHARKLEEQHPFLKRGGSERPRIATQLPGESREFRPPLQQPMPPTQSVAAPTTVFDQSYNDPLHPQRLGGLLGGEVGEQEFQKLAESKSPNDDTLAPKLMLAVFAPQVPAHRYSLAVTLHNRAALQWLQGHRPTALRNQQAAVTLLQRLCKESPGEPTYCRDLTLALLAQSKMHFHQGEYASARQRFESGMGVMRRGFPDIRMPQLTASYDQDLRSCRLYMRHYLWCVTEIALREGKHQEAAALAELLPQIGDAATPDYQASSLRSASILARCSCLAEKDTTLSRSERLQLQQHYRETARQLIPTDEVIQAGCMGTPNVFALHGFGWFFAHGPDVALRDPARAVALAEHTVQYTGVVRGWLLLAMARYRAGQFAQARHALEQARRLHRGGDAWDWLLLALLDAQDGKLVDAKEWQRKAMAWLKEHPTAEDGLLRLVREVEEKLRALGV